MTGRTLALSVVICSLGCGGMMGYGAEVATTPVSSATPFTASYTPKTNLPHQVWLDYDLTLNGDWKVTGTLDAKVGSGSVGSWQLDFDGSGAPIVGSSGEFKLNAVQTVVNGNGSARGTVWLFEIPGQTSGTPVDVTGTFTQGPMTTINSMRLVVTE